MECSEVKAGQTLTQETAAISIRSGMVKAFASVQLRRAAGEASTDSCQVVYKLFVAHPDGKFVLTKQYSEKADGSVGAEMIGASPNERMLAADFWWAEGDYTGHRPVIYNVETRSAQSRALHDEIRKQLPSCDYFEEFIGVSDAGEAIIRVPQSAYVEKGCHAQGKWLFDMQSGRVHRLKSSNNPK